MHFPNSQKELTVSLRISEFWMGKKKKKNTNPKNPTHATNTYDIFYNKEDYIFHPRFHKSISPFSLRNSVFSYFCNDFFKPRKSLCLNANFTLTDCDDMMDQILSYFTASSRLLQVFTQFNRYQFRSQRVSTQFSK